MADGDGKVKPMDFREAVQKAGRPLRKLRNLIAQARTLNASGKAFDPNLHPRYPKGHPKAGQFIDKPAGASAAPAARPAPTPAPVAPAPAPRPASTASLPTAPAPLVLPLITARNMTNTAVTSANKAISNYQVLANRGDVAGLQAVTPTVPGKNANPYQRARHAAHQQALAHAQGIQRAGAAVATPAIPASATKAIPGAQAAVHVAASPAAPQTLKLSDLTQTGPAGGSNPGGIFKHNQTGEEYYVKLQRTNEHADNEILASELYKAAGHGALDMRRVDLGGGKFGTASAIVAKRSLTASSPADAALMERSFGTHAWLANWDGVLNDNMALVANRATTMDVGGALLMRAQGGPKGAAFGDKVTEFATLRNPSVNAAGAAVFGGITPARMIDSVSDVAKVDDATIRRLVAAHGPGDAAAKAAMEDRLIKRRDDLLDQAEAELAAKGVPHKFARHNAATTAQAAAPPAPATPAATAAAAAPTPPTPAAPGQITAAQSNAARQAAMATGQPIPPATLAAINARRASLGVQPVGSNGSPILTPTQAAQAQLRAVQGSPITPARLVQVNATRATQGLPPINANGTAVPAVAPSAAARPVSAAAPTPPAAPAAKTLTPAQVNNIRGRAITQGQPIPTNELVAINNIRAGAGQVPIGPNGRTSGNPPGSIPPVTAPFVGAKPVPVTASTPPVTATPTGAPVTASTASPAIAASGGGPVPASSLPPQPTIGSATNKSYQKHITAMWNLASTKGANSVAAYVIPGTNTYARQTLRAQGALLAHLGWTGTPPGLAAGLPATAAALASTATTAKALRAQMKAAAAIKPKIARGDKLASVLSMSVAPGGRGVSIPNMKGLEDDINAIIRAGTPKGISLKNAVFVDDATGVVVATDRPKLIAQRIAYHVGAGQPPTVVSKSAMDALVAVHPQGQGFRTMNPVPGHKAQALADQVRDGELFWGNGIYGHGTYVAAAVPSTGMVKGAPVGPQTVKAAEYDSSAYATSGIPPATMVRLHVPDDANLLKFSEISSDAAFQKAKAATRTITTAIRSANVGGLSHEVVDALQDGGTVALLAGYDGILVDNRGTYSYINVVNRGRLTIQKENHRG